MKYQLTTISDVTNLPSVLPIEDVNYYMEQLLNIISKSQIDPLTASNAINNLIGSQGYNEVGLSLEISEKILNWVKDNYDSDDKDLIESCSANLANLTCREAKKYLQNLLTRTKTMEEKDELEGALREIDIKE